jgi:hypothetical protein
MVMAMVINNVQASDFIMLLATYRMVMMLTIIEED